jgi:hypothetical protein
VVHSSSYAAFNGDAEIDHGRLCRLKLFSQPSELLALALLQPVRSLLLVDEQLLSLVEEVGVLVVLMSQALSPGAFPLVLLLQIINSSLGFLKRSSLSLGITRSLLLLFAQLFAQLCLCLFESGNCLDMLLAHHAYVGQPAVKPQDGRPETDYAVLHNIEAVLLHADPVAEAGEPLLVRLLLLG